MWQYCQKRKGFTLIEILIVIALMGVIAGFLMAAFKNFASYQQYNQAAGDVEFVLKQTRLNARSAVIDEPHGVHVSVNGITQFNGDTYNVSDPTNIVILYELVTLETNLTGGVDTIVFDKLTGRPSATGTIKIIGTNFEASTTIQISEAGVIQ